MNYLVYVYCFDKGYNELNGYNEIGEKINNKCGYCHWFTSIKKAKEYVKTIKNEIIELTKPYFDDCSFITIDIELDNDGEFRTIVDYLICDNR